jgi:WhiB family redox-sensing transcriptional regulator
MTEVRCWRDQAACREVVTAEYDPFFADSAELQVEAIAICEACPVRDACLTFAVRTGQQYGIWGGHRVAEQVGHHPGAGLQGAERPDGPPGQGHGPHLQWFESGPPFRHVSPLQRVVVERHARWRPRPLLLRTRWRQPALCKPRDPD